ncbi:unnamed protein product [Lathyrus sativus]|nr:unnamed protein product [Lathyrus sativus]
MIALEVELLPLLVLLLCGFACGYSVEPSSLAHVVCLPDGISFHFICMIAVYCILLDSMLFIFQYDYCYSFWLEVEMSLWRLKPHTHFLPHLHCMHFTVKLMLCLFWCIIDMIP